MSSRIEDYGLIGDCTSAALVSKSGSIDWLCWPRFDSDACFAALLGDRNNGRWLIAPTEAARIERQYRPDTLVLETTFTTATGRIRLSDFMIRKDEALHLVRLVAGELGTIDVESELILRFGYGTTVPWVTRVDDGSLRIIAGPDMVVFRTPVPHTGVDFTTVSRFSIKAGQTIPFVLSWRPSHRSMPPPIDPLDALRSCEAEWHAWVREGAAPGKYEIAVKRSLVTLKALTFAPTGGIVAAPTTSLPEAFGGPRNWDYRYCWIRDATFTLLAMMNAGHFREAGAWHDWLRRAVAGDPADMRIMYGIMGERRLTEWEVDWLPGYENARPVRVGNAAHQQFQLDIYGELMDAFAHARRGGLAATESGWSMQQTLLDHLAEVWQQPDQGLWEMRGPPRHFTFSKAMAWVAFDRGVAAIDQYGLPGPRARWAEIRDQIHREVTDHGYNAKDNHFRMSYEEDCLDASLLLLAQIGFVTPDDPRFVGTVAAIERDLLADGFVRRYDTRAVTDGLPPEEAAFLACTCWLADAYAMMGRTADAEALFEHVLAVRNDLGLLAEEYDPARKRLAGNFPQAFSHVALINTAFNLSRSAKPAEQRAQQAGASSAAA